MAAAKILIVEDDPKTVELVKLYLTRDGYRVIAAGDGLTGLQQVAELRPDLIILDLMLPGMDGIEICHRLRRESEVPIILLTARSTDDDKLIGLEAGADDYVTKPFSPRELAARVRVILRRLPGGRVPETLIRGELVIDFGHHFAKVSGVDLHLTAVELRILGALAREPGRVLARAQIIDEALSPDFEGFDRTIDVHIRNIRRKFAQTPMRDSVQTVYGAGYKFSMAGADDSQL
jgi:two-component system, OmpR family, alkaline phosphatase synthesis response regulator PhoP